MKIKVYNRETHLKNDDFLYCLITEQTMRLRMKFSEKVKHSRMKLLLMQKALTKELSVSYATICHWEKKNRELQIISQGKSYTFCESRGVAFDD